MEEKIKSLLVFLESEMEKTTEDMVELNNQLAKLTNISADEFSLTGDHKEGRVNKQSIIDGIKFQKALFSGILSQTERFMNVIQMSEEQLTAMNNSMKLVRQQAKERKENMKHEASSTLPDQNSTFHTDWCPLKGTDKPWAVSAECVCPGAYIIRKRMSEGMTFEEAKKYVIDNEAI